MKNLKNIILFSPVVISLFFFSCSGEENEQSKGAFYTNDYPNLFKDLLGKDESEIIQKINSAFEQLFYGNDSTQRIYYPVEPDMAYIVDINNKDVRTEGMSYGMMVSVQMDKKNDLDR